MSVGHGIEFTYFGFEIVDFRFFLSVFIKKKMGQKIHPFSEKSEGQAQEKLFIYSKI